MSFRCLILIVLLCLFYSAMYSQDVKEPDIVFLSGFVYDMDLEKMPYVNISINKRHFFISDQNGHYETYIQATDTLTFSYSGYETSVISLTDAKFSADTFYMEILMKLKPYEIPGATIVPYTSYSQFREAFIHLDPEDIDRLNATINSDIIDSQLKSNIVPDNDAQSATKNSMIMKDYNNNSLVFLSSDPNKGLFAAMTALGIRLPFGLGRSRR